VVDAPVELTGVAIEVRALAPRLDAVMRWTGLSDPGPAIRVVLAPESAEVAKSSPAWVSGFARPAESLVVLFPGRLGAYPDASLERLLLHEVAHVLIHRAAGGQAVPRWFDEGLAMAASRETEIGDRARVALAVMSETSLPLARIDQTFTNRRANPTSAYALAQDFVRDLIRRFGPGIGADILAGLARGESFPIAFRVATGVGLDEVEQSYWQRRSWWDRWVPLLSSSAVLWAVITLLALAAFRRRAAIDAEVRAGWEEHGDLEPEAAAPAELEGPEPDDDEVVN
jgi:hypothetical protein